MMYILTPFWLNHVLISFFLSFHQSVILFFLFFSFFFRGGVNCMMPHPSTHVQSGCGGTCQRHIDRDGHATTCSAYLMDGARTLDGGISNYWKAKWQTRQRSERNYCKFDLCFKAAICFTCAILSSCRHVVLQNSCSMMSPKKKKCISCYVGWT